MKTENRIMIGKRLVLTLTREEAKARGMSALTRPYRLWTEESSLASLAEDMERAGCAWALVLIERTPGFSPAAEVWRAGLHSGVQFERTLSARYAAAARRRMIDDSHVLRFPSYV